MQSQESTGIHIEGHIKIYNPESGEIFIDKRNAIHYENISIALANSLAAVSYTHLTLPTNREV